jgi:hypothetical protein
MNGCTVGSGRDCEDTSLHSPATKFQIDENIGQEFSHFVRLCVQVCCLSYRNYTFYSIYYNGF